VCLAIIGYIWVRVCRVSRVACRVSRARPFHPYEFNYAGVDCVCMAIVYLWMRLCEGVKADRGEGGDDLGAKQKKQDCFCDRTHDWRQLTLSLFLSPFLSLLYLPLSLSLCLNALSKSPNWLKKHEARLTRVKLTRGCVTLTPALLQVISTEKLPKIAHLHIPGSPFRLHVNAGPSYAPTV
jgi:hypothetical protein